MFRVPESAEEPSFDRTFRVSALAFLIADEETRREWARRRSVATERARPAQVAEETTPAMSDEMLERIVTVGDGIVDTFGRHRADDETPRARHRAKD